MATIVAAGGEALALRADLTQEAEVERVVAATVDRFGGIDVPVANTGGLLQHMTEPSRLKKKKKTAPFF